MPTRLLVAHTAIGARQHLSGTPRTTGRQEAWSQPRLHRVAMTCLPLMESQIASRQILEMCSNQLSRSAHGRHHSTCATCVVYIYIHQRRRERNLKTRAPSCAGQNHPYKVHMRPPRQAPVSHSRLPLSCSDCKPVQRFDSPMHVVYTRSSHDASCRCIRSPPSFHARRSMQVLNAKRTLLLHSDEVVAIHMTLSSSIKQFPTLRLCCAHATT